MKMAKREAMKEVREEVSREVREEMLKQNIINLMRNAHFIHLFLNTQENTLEALKPGCLGLNPGFVTYLGQVT